RIQQPPDQAPDQADQCCQPQPWQPGTGNAIAPPWRTQFMKKLPHTADFPAIKYQQQTGQSEQHAPPAKTPLIIAKAACSQQEKCIDANKPRTAAAATTL